MAKKKTKRIMVTGGAGFIGSHVTDALIKKGYKVVVVDDLSSGKLANLNPKAKLYKMNILSNRLASVMKKERIEVVYHLAAQVSVSYSVRQPLRDAEQNIHGTINLLESMNKAGVKKIIYSSTGGAIYGGKAKLPATEKTCPAPDSPYGVSKFASENYVRVSCGANGIDYTILRYANVYGPRQDAHGEAGVIAIFMDRMMKGKQAVINGSGSITRDYVYVGDVVRANLAALNKRCTGPVNIATGREISLSTLFETLNKLIGADQKKVIGPARAGDVKRSVLSRSLAKRQLNWVPKVTLEQGLKKTVSWFKIHRSE